MTCLHDDTSFVCSNCGKPDIHCLGLGGASKPLHVECNSVQNRLRKLLWEPDDSAISHAAFTVSSVHKAGRLSCKMSAGQCMAVQRTCTFVSRHICHPEEHQVEVCPLSRTHYLISSNSHVTPISPTSALAAIVSAGSSNSLHSMIEAGGISY